MKKVFYNLANFIILSIIVSVFIMRFIADIFDIFAMDSYQESVCLVAIILIEIIFVYGIKSLRLYIMIFDKGSISLSKHMVQFLKTIPASIIIPFKLGDLFRAYVYGFWLNDYFAGAVVIFLDRFFDSLALVIVLLSIGMVYAHPLPWIAYILLFFMIVAIACFLSFMPAYIYWNNYFIQSKTTRINIKILANLKAIEKGYKNISEIIHGRGGLLFILSLFAWIIEVGSTMLIGIMFTNDASVHIVYSYLSSAVTGHENIYIQRLICVSCIAIIFSYTILKLFIEFKRRHKSDRCTYL